ncbi:protein extra-macrochaetae-like [Penaeus chinensis]|uniref:protein extra-macrochaetae-like n=1 Tax=Penaeus chinensis TaxID=139456 RepID=UPI001FB6F066|nr:protein extra-macrochaetae-like [Penaeus chinensis]
MRAQRCVSPVQAVMGVMDGKIRKAPLKSDGADQVLLYLERLQHLVPQCPKDRPVTKLELIQSVIDYIYDLEDALEPESSDDESSDVASTSEDEMECVESS